MCEALTGGIAMDSLLAHPCFVQAASNDAGDDMEMLDGSPAAGAGSAGGVGGVGGGGGDGSGGSDAGYNSQYVTRPEFDKAIQALKDDMATGFAGIHEKLGARAQAPLACTK